MIDTNKDSIPENKYAAMKPTLCTVDFIYIVSRHLVYSNSDYYLEREYSSPYVVHTSYEDDGYLSFLLPIMYNSTYFLVVKDEYFLQAFPDGNWINKAISRIRKNQHPTIVTCNGKPQTRYGSVVADTDGSILMETRYLRYILTMTDFRRSSISPFFFFSQAVLCRFNAAIVTQTCPFFDAHYVSKSSYLASLFGMTERTIDNLSTDCISALGIQDVNCSSIRPQDHSIGIVLSQYKREYVDEQLESIYASSLPPSEIILFQNGHFKNYQYIAKKYPIQGHIWAVNWNSPFFLRHLLPLLLKTSYHIVFDDDIIPGKDTISTLISVIDEKDTPTGVGGRYIPKSSYTHGTYQMICADCEYKRYDHEVDFVIQVYAKKAIHSKIFWRYEPYSQRNGDDIHGSLSFVVECGRYPWRPAFFNDSHYKNYGHDSVASYITTSHQVIRPRVFRHWLMAGFRPLMGDEVYDEYPDTSSKLEHEYLQSMKYF